MNGLQKSIIYLNGVGPNRQKILKEEFGISTIQDLLNVFPNRYIDRGRLYKINVWNNMKYTCPSSKSKFLFSFIYRNF